MADLERKKKSMVMNGKGKKAKKGATKSTSSKKKRKTSKKTGAKKTTRRRSSKRKRNPGVDIVGSLVAAAGGALAGAIAAPAATAAGKLSKNPTTQKALETAAAGVVPFGVGLAVQMFSPALGKGMCAGAGAAVAERALGMAAGKVELLSKAGYRMHMPADLSLEAGQVFRQMPDGRKLVLFAADAKTAELTMPDGTKKTAQLLGAADDGQVVVLDEYGQLQVLTATSLEGIEPASELSGIEPANQLGGIQPSALQGDDTDTYADSDGYTA